MSNTLCVPVEFPAIEELRMLVILTIDSNLPRSVVDLALQTMVWSWSWRHWRHM